MLLCFLLGIRAQIPYGLNSYIAPNTATILLDFDGQTVTDPYWTAFTNNQPFVCGPDTSMTTAQMTRVFNLVAEDFRPFTINVTTDSAVFLATPITRRTRVIITQSWQWYGNAGGVAYLESWRWGGLGYGTIPCFVFSSLLKGDDKDVAEAVTHEVGHTLGLFHQSQYRNVDTDSCAFVTEYHAGRGTPRSETSWSPIMGVSYFRNLSLWHNDRTTSCTRFQDDLAIIASTANFVKYRTDDVGNDRSTSRLMLDQNYAINGIINTTNDVDYYRFDYTKTGQFRADAKPYSPGPKIFFDAFEPKDNTPNQGANIDLKLQLYRNDVLIREYNSLTKVDALIDTILNPGIYYLVVSNTENPNIYNYGMLGSYNITGVFDGQTPLDFQPTEWITNIREQINLITIYGDMNTGIYFLNLPNRNNFREVRIFTITGVLYKTINGLHSVNKIDLSKYPPGVYVVNVDGIKSFKIIKQ
jgi:hypothetical protein